MSAQWPSKWRASSGCPTRASWLTASAFSRRAAAPTSCRTCTATTTAVRTCWSQVARFGHATAVTAALTTTAQCSSVATAVDVLGRRIVHSCPPATPSAAQAHQVSVCLLELMYHQHSHHLLRHPAGGSCSSTRRPDKELWSGPPGGADLLQQGHGGAAGARLWAAAAPRACAADGPGGHHRRRARHADRRQPRASPAPAPRPEGLPAACQPGSMCKQASLSLTVYMRSALQVGLTKKSL